MQNNNHRQQSYSTCDGQNIMLQSTTCFLSPIACPLIREKQSGRSEELAIPYRHYTAVLKRPSHWLNPLSYLLTGLSRFFKEWPR